MSLSNQILCLRVDDEAVEGVLEVLDAVASSCTIPKPPRNIGGGSNRGKLVAFGRALPKVQRAMSWRLTVEGYDSAACCIDSDTVVASCDLKETM